MIVCLLTIVACSEPTDEDGYQLLFNGQDLDGWEGDPTYWRVENGEMIGEITPETVVDRNTFLIWRGGRPADFDLRVEYRLSPDANSGINYRSEEVEGVPFALRGYQGDMNYAGTYTGMNYEERGRTTIARRGEKVVLPPVGDTLDDFILHNRWAPRRITDTLSDPDAPLRGINPDQWNEYRILARGNRLQHFINDTLLSDVTDEDPVHRRSEGLIGVQVHVGPPMQVRFRNWRLRKIDGEE
ncbi:DUF1080 domain-containing protein [Lewinella sp. IMCC34191]|uniref:3-keto-disaccharide hydrolase n=1 Tax=Lewinella sp. IMCC34191 TaxID=2259172 RepID=UPI0018E52127|nr:DUF1080 domain-containing protein [Lewinella sp. IMCC34191]